MRVATRESFPPICRYSPGCPARWLEWTLATFRTEIFSPIFLTILSHSGDEAPEGILAIPAANSPTGNDILVVTNEDSGTVSFYENK